MKHRSLTESQLLHMRIRSQESTPEAEIELLEEEKKLLLAEVRHLRAALPSLSSHATTAPGASPQSALL